MLNRLTRENKTISQLVNYHFYWRPTFLSGFKSAFDIWGNLSPLNDIEIDEDVDIISLRNDWISIGNDISFAIKSYKTQNSAKILSNKKQILENILKLPHNI